MVCASRFCAGPTFLTCLDFLACRARSGKARCRTETWMTFIVPKEGVHPIDNEPCARHGTFCTRAWRPPCHRAKPIQRLGAQSLSSSYTQAGSVPPIVQRPVRDGAHPPRGCSESCWLSSKPGAGNRPARTGRTQRPVRRMPPHDARRTGRPCPRRCESKRPRAPTSLQLPRPPQSSAARSFSDWAPLMADQSGARVWLCRREAAARSAIRAKRRSTTLPRRTFRVPADGVP